MNSVFINKKLLSALKVVSLVIIGLILSLLMRAWSFSDLTLNPEAKIIKLTSGDAVQIFSNEEFKLYYVESDKNISHYAFLKRFGIWYCEAYPDKYNISGLSHGKYNIYYYGDFASNGKYDYIENEQGEKIYPYKYELDGKVLSVYKIPKYKDKKVDFRFRDNNNLINDQALLLNGEVIFYKLANGKNTEYKTKVEKLQQDDPYLWAQIEKTITSADKSKEIEDGRVYNQVHNTVFKVILNYNTGDFISIEKGHKAYDWTGEISYDIEIKGQHPNTIGIYTRDYSKVSLYEKIFVETHVYPVIIPKDLVDYLEGL